MSITTKQQLAIDTVKELTTDVYGDKVKYEIIVKDNGEVLVNETILLNISDNFTAWKIGKQGGIYIQNLDTCKWDYSGITC